MNKKQLRRLAATDPVKFRAHITGARKRDLKARALLINPEKLATADEATKAAVAEYISEGGWRSLYLHDRRMYRLLKAGAEKIKHHWRVVENRKLLEAITRGRVVRGKLAEAEGGSVSAKRAAERLGISQAELLRHYHDGRILGWRTSSKESVRFPVWQFRYRKLLPGIQDALARLNSDPRLDDFGRLLFFLSNSLFLGGQRPLDYLRSGQVAQVLKAARGFLQ